MTVVVPGVRSRRLGSPTDEIDRLPRIAPHVGDDLPNGIRDSVPEAADFVEGDLDAVFHLAADKYVNADRPPEQFESNEAMTYTLLERMDEFRCGQDLVHFVLNGI